MVFYADSGVDEPLGRHDSLLGAADQVYCNMFNRLRIVWT